MEKKKWTDKDLRTAFEDGCKFANFNDLVEYLRQNKNKKTKKFLSFFKKSEPLSLRYVKFNVLDGGGSLGMIRTVPENYYVASVMCDGKLVFFNIESKTKDINKRKVKRWYKKFSPLF